MHYSSPCFIEGTVFQDDRGKLISCSDFYMEAVKRMYLINPVSVDVIRAWQAHRFEEKWFCCLNGSFEVKLLHIDNFDQPSDFLNPLSYLLESSSPGILYVPGGYANGFKANSEQSCLMVFSSFNLAQSKADDFRYPADKWNLWE